MRANDQDSNVAQAGGLPTPKIIFCWIRAIAPKNIRRSSSILARCMPSLWQPMQELALFKG